MVFQCSFIYHLYKYIHIHFHIYVSSSLTFNSILYIMLLFFFYLKCVPHKGVHMKSRTPKKMTKQYNRKKKKKKELIFSSFLFHQHRKSWMSLTLQRVKETEKNLIVHRQCVENNYRNVLCMKDWM